MSNKFGLTPADRTILVPGVNYITTNSKWTTVPFFRVGVSENSFPLFQILEALGLNR